MRPAVGGRYAGEVNALGGWGAPVRGTGPDGVERAGLLQPSRNSDQRPHLVDLGSSRRYALESYRRDDGGDS